MQDSFGLGIVRHLGDQIYENSVFLRLAKRFNKPVYKGPHFRQELFDLYPDYYTNVEFVEKDGPNKQFPWDYTHDPFYIQFDLQKSQYVKGLPKSYITIQFDSIYEENIKNQKQIIDKYNYDVIDIGNKNYNLAQTLYVVAHSQGHVGANSGMSNFALCVPNTNCDKFVHVYSTMYESDNTQCFTLACKLNGGVFYGKECFM
jgi:hypothetical protein